MGDEVEAGWDDIDAGSVVPWLISFLVLVVVAWLIWFFRHRIIQIYLERKNLQARAAPFVIPSHLQPRINAALATPSSVSSAIVCAPQLKPEPAQEIHWQWVSTGKPPTPLPEFRGRSKTIVSSNFHARRFSLRSGVSASASIDSVRFSIGGYETPSYCSNVHSLSIPSQSLQSQKSCFPKMSNRKYKMLLNRICSVTDPDLKREIFDLIFETIQLGDWTDHDWNLFVKRLFSENIGGEEYVVDLQNDLRSKYSKFSDIVNLMLQCWLGVNGIDKSDFKMLYEALECCDKSDVAHNAAINVVLVLRRKQGRTESDCFEPFSEYEETPLNSLELDNSMPPRSPSRNSQTHNSPSQNSPSLKSAERALAIQNGLTLKCIHYAHNPHMRQRSKTSGCAYSTDLNEYTSL